MSVEALRLDEHAGDRHDGTSHRRHRACGRHPGSRRRTAAARRRAQRFPGLRHIFADAAYAGGKLEQALAKLGNWTLEIVRRCDAAKGFQFLPRRWVVERTIAWLNRNRRLAKDFKATIECAQAWLMIASVKLLARRIARP